VVSGGGDGAAGDLAGADLAHSDLAGADLAHSDLAGPAADAGDPIVAIVLSPLAPTREVLDGQLTSPLTFAAEGRTRSGALVPASGSWSFDRPDLGSIDVTSGSFSPTLSVGGTGTVTFTSGSLVGTTSVTIQLHETSDTQGVSAAIKSAFGTASQPDPLLQLLYPSDGTVFPRGIGAPVQQWSGGDPADTYYVHITSSAFELEFWGTVAPPSRYVLPAVPRDVWRELTLSAASVSVAVQRFSAAAGTAYLPLTRLWTIAPGEIAGVIYFAEELAAFVERIYPAQGGAPATPFPPLSSTITCTGCHSVSRDGERIALSVNGGSYPWASYSARDGSFVFLDYDGGPATGSGFQAITPDGVNVLWGQERALAYLSLNAYNSATELSKLNPGVATAFPVSPAWSPDGRSAAFSMRSDGDWMDYTTASLWIADFDPLSLVFSNPRSMVPSSATRPSQIYPAFTPDSQWIAFARATQASLRGGTSDLWLTTRDGATPIALDRASGTGTSAAGTSSYPSFLPVAVGGYFWMVLTSQRPYGNTLTDTGPTSRMDQIWVSAIDRNPTAGGDPSHPAFWLPGQDLTTQNGQGDWGLVPCQAAPASCSAGFECCTGHCAAGVCAGGAAGCSPIGDACARAADCCSSSAACVDGFCAL
jgi:hypothetical protein